MIFFKKKIIYLYFFSILSISLLFSSCSNQELYKNVVFNPFKNIKNENVKEVTPPPGIPIPKKNSFFSIPIPNKDNQKDKKNDLSPPV